MKILISSGLTLALLMAGSLWWLATDMDAQLSGPLAVTETSVLTIEPGASLTTIANGIVDKGWLPHPYYLMFEARRNGLAEKIQSGEYEITPGMTPGELLQRIVSGKVLQYSLTIPEGWTVRQIIQTVRDNKTLVKTLEQTDPEYVMATLGLDGTNAEGRFFPDTYNFPAGTTDVDFLRRAYDTMTRILEQEWQQRGVALPYQSAYEALIMASIIEKETAVADERHAIAGVFVRRLQKNMKLQTDPSVIYAIGESFDGDIRRKDLSIDSPYNTYRYRGLPPTPIASPGRASIHAALHPDPGTALYFVAMGNGRHYFSETLAEHNQAVARYQLNKVNSEK